MLPFNKSWTLEEVPAHGQKDEGDAVFKRGK